MPVRVKCEKCKKTLSVKDHLAGKKIKCPVCQNVVAVPAESGLPEAPAKKPPIAGKLAPPKKPPADPTKTNGTPPVTAKPKSNGVPVKPPEPAAAPPENVEDEALSALSEKPAKQEDEGPPKTIDFRCEWCDEELHLPIDLGGKQTQCPNVECKRIIKVPLPKIVEKKDWRKMDRRGPAAALVSQPEQLDDAWGTQEAVQARQASLQQAGVVADPAKKPVGVSGWLRRGFIAAGVAGLLLLAGLGVNKMRSMNVEVSALKEIDDLTTGSEPKIKDPLLLACASRTRGLLLLHSTGFRAKEARNALKGALVKFELAKDKPAINEQLFLIELALAQIELGGGGDDVLVNRSRRIKWDEVREDLNATLDKIKTSEVKVLALRQVCTQLIVKGQPDIARGMAGTLSNIDPATKAYPLPYRQQITLLYLCEKLDDLADVKEPDPSKELHDVHIRVGFTEGYVRKGMFEEALKLAQVKGPAMDRLEAHLSAAAALRGNKERSAMFLKEAREVAGQNKLTLSPWQQLEMVKVAARLDDADAVKEVLDGLKKEPAFKLRAHLEIFLAGCEKSTGPVNVDDLQDLETIDKEGTTLALAWLALAQRNARLGYNVAKNRSTFEQRLIIANLPPEVLDKVRPMVDVGTYLGSMK